MVVGAVDDGDVHGLAGERPRRREPSEASANDQHPSSQFVRHDPAIMSHPAPVGAVRASRLARFRPAVVCKIAHGVFVAVISGPGNLGGAASRSAQWARAREEREAVERGGRSFRRVPGAGLLMRPVGSGRATRETRRHHGKTTGIYEIVLGILRGDWPCRLRHVATPDGRRRGRRRQLVVALTASSIGGTTYRLVSSSFLITGNSSQFSAVLTGDAPTVERDLAPGSYNIQLLGGFVLDEVNRDGTETAIPATLTSQNPLSFGIRSQHVTSVSFTFKVGEGVVATGDGTVSVGATIDDGLIDDFEDGDGHIAKIGGRNGTWFSFNDGSGQQTPAPGVLLSPEVDPFTTNFFLRSTGTGFVNSAGSPSLYGAGIGTAMLEVGGFRTPYDASGYGGIAFTYKLLSGPYSAQLRLNVATSATTPVEFGGLCTQGCNDDFGYAVPFSNVSCYYYTGFLCTATVPFSQLAQVGFGTPTTFDPSTIVSLKWQISWPFFSPSSGANFFDFSLDDVSFVSPGNAISGTGGFSGGIGGFFGGIGGFFGGTGGFSGGSGGFFGGSGGLSGGIGGFFGGAGGSVGGPGGPGGGSGGAGGSFATGGSFGGNGGISGAAGSGVP